jgi:uracil-DNA glycosylase
MNWTKFENQFHESWHDRIKPFIESKECDEIYEFLKKESRRGKRIAPLSSDTFKAFKLTPLTDLKVVILGMCPYHTAINGVPVADGLLMGCSVTRKLQPSLDQFYDALEDDVYNGLNLKYYKNPDVSYLANQGVLMFNAALTTEINKAGSHLDVWEPFTRYVFEHILYYTGVPIVFLGKESTRYKHYVPPMGWSFVLSHPASASYKGTEWSSEGVFSQVNKILMDNNGFKINWLDEDPPF